MEFRILGPLEVVHEEQPVALGGSRERALLALLLLSANRVVSAERLAEDLWAGRAPHGAAQALRVYMSRLRKSLREADGEGLLLTQAPGYMARVPVEDLDVAQFESLVVRGRAATAQDDHEGAAKALSEALGLWRGPALADVADAPFARAEAARLEEARLAALEERVEADLACGRHGELAGELDALTRAHPLRERLWAQRMVALYRCGRQADALRAYQELRALLGDELGLEPSIAVARLEGAILRHDPALEWPPTDREEPVTPGPSGSLEGVVTFLFTDLVGSTQWLERLSEDGAEELRRTHFTILREAVSEAGGQEVKNLGDGLMVAFASPLAALGCAVGIQRRVAEHNGVDSERRLSVRVGLQAGEATRAENDFFGTAVVAAKRLCDRADGGQILAGELVSSLVGSRGDFQFRPLGPVFLKGLAVPVPAVEVGWRSRAETAPTQGDGEVAPLPLPPFLGRAGGIFVGRQEELDRLWAVWKETATVGRRVLLVGGEPGVGKTRLATVFAGELHDDGVTVLAGRCDEDLGVPFQPFVDALRHVVDHTPPAEIPARLGRFAGELVRLVPELAGRVPGLAAPLRSDPETERYRLFDAVAAWLGTVAGGEPVVLVIDDLQWAAKPTLLLLRHLVRSPECSSLLVLATYRDTELGAGHPLPELLADLRRDEAVERLALSGLDEAAVLAFVEGAAGHDLDEDDRPLVRAIHQETDGNPFFVWELVRHLTETGVLVHRQGRWTALQSRLGTTEGVRDVLRRRLTRLSETANLVLNAASVVGIDFEVGAVREVCGLEEEDLVVALDEAAAARLVRETGVGAFRFVHAIVRSTLYEALSATRRAQLHLQTADVLQQRGDLVGLAHHLLASVPLADRARTAAACLAGGDQALAALADAEAAEWFTQGLPFAEHDHRLRIDLMTGLGEAQRRTGDSASRQTLLDASRMAVDHGDVARLVRAVLANNRGFFSVSGAVDVERVELIDTALSLVGPSPTAARAELLALLAVELVWASDHERRLHSADEAAAIAELLNDVSVQARVGMQRLWACLAPDRVGALVSEGANTVRFADASADPQLRVFSRSMWVLALQTAGELDEARRWAHEAVVIAEESGQPGLRCIAGLFHSAAVDALGDHDDAVRLADATLEFGQRAGWPDAVMWYGGVMWLHWTFGGQADVGAAVAAAALTEYPLLAWRGARAMDLALTTAHDELADVLTSLPATLPPVPWNYYWLITHFYFAAAQGFGVEDRQVATDMYRLLLPFRHLHATYGLGHWGPIEMALAVVARVTGDVEAALAHHEAASGLIEASGTARARAFNGYQWAVTLLARGAPGDRRRAAELRDQTLEWCRAKGYVTFMRWLEDLPV